MYKKMFSLVALLGLAMGAKSFASPSESALGNYVLDVPGQFGAPVVRQTSDVTNPALGALIYDNSTGIFRGYQSNGWVDVTSANGSQAPQVTVLTTANNGSTYTPPTGALWLEAEMVASAQPTVTP